MCTQNFYFETIEIFSDFRILLLYSEDELIPWREELCCNVMLTFLRPNTTFVRCQTELR